MDRNEVQRVYYDGARPKEMEIHDSRPARSRWQRMMIFNEKFQKKYYQKSLRRVGSSAAAFSKRSSIQMQSAKRTKYQFSSLITTTYQKAEEELYTIIKIKKQVMLVGC